jgi:hypothetical protein
MITPNIRLAGIVCVVVLLFNWSRFDYIIAGVLLLGTGLAIEIVLRVVKKTRYRIALGLAILAMLALVWIEVAVGLFGSPIAGS